MDKDNLKKSILERIETEHIEPTSRWRFQFRNFALWISGILAMVIGGLAVAVIIFTIVNGPWAMREHLDQSLIGFVFNGLPYIWMISLAVFLVVAHFNVRHTKQGYRYSMLNLVSGAILLSLVLGVAFYAVGLGHATDEVVAKGIPAYRPMAQRQLLMLHRPENGVISGIVITVESMEMFEIKDVYDETWEITNKDEHTLKNGVQFVRGNRVILIGDKIGDKMFEACIIKPLVIKGKSDRFMHHVREFSSDERRYLLARSTECGPLNK